MTFTPGLFPSQVVSIIRALYFELVGYSKLKLQMERAAASLGVGPDGTREQSVWVSAEIETRFSNSTAMTFGDKELL